LIEQCQIRILVSVDGAMGAPDLRQEDGAMHAGIDSTRTAVQGRLQGATRQPTLRSLLFGVMAQLAAWQDRWRQRRILESMGDRAMHDLALSRADIDREASKPFWQR